MKSQNKIRKVHITYNVKEFERITDPIIDSNPDKVYYFHHEGDNKDIYLDHRDKNLKVIKNQLPEIEIEELGVDYVDYYDIIAKLASILSREKGARVTINMGTGSKMVAIANLDAHRLWNTELIYPYSLDYDPTKKSTHSGTMIAAELPKFELKTPPVPLIKVLQIIYWLMTHDKFGRDKKQVRQIDIQKAVFETYKLDQVKKNPSDRNYDSSQKMKLRRSYLNKLKKKWKFITISSRGRANYIEFTPNGLKMAKVFMQYDYGINFIESAPDR